MNFLHRVRKAPVLGRHGKKNSFDNIAVFNAEIKSAVDFWPKPLNLGGQVLDFINSYFWRVERFRVFVAV